MAERHGKREVVHTYEITEQLAVRLTEITRRAHCPVCPSCGEGDYWHVTWPTSVLLSRHVAAPARARTLADKRVLVIGGGTGLEAITLAKLGAVVSVLDHMPAALELVARNCRLNAVERMTQYCCCWQDARAVRRLPTHEVVIGSDVLYDAATARGVQRVLTTVLRPGGRGLVADPVRSCGTGTATFRHLMTYAGFRLRSHWITSSVYDRERRAKVYTLTPPAPVLPPYGRR
jgi:predicted nicotinamide N-methyase